MIPPDSARAAEPARHMPALDNAKAMASAREWFKDQHMAPCGLASCDSVYCFAANVLADYERLRAEVAAAEKEADDARQDAANLAVEMRRQQLRLDSGNDCFDSLDEAVTAKLTLVGNLREAVTRAEAEVAAAREDTKRLDWIERAMREADEVLEFMVVENGIAVFVGVNDFGHGKTLREAIDAARSLPAQAPK